VSALEWDETNYPHKVANKAIDTSFLADMTGDLCDAEYRDGWGRLQSCVRVAGHTGCLPRRMLGPGAGVPADRRRARGRIPPSTGCESARG
jgi:hypothetical protein